MTKHTLRTSTVHVLPFIRALFGQLCIEVNLFHIDERTRDKRRFLSGS
jgi:hypothetical protein